MKILRQLKKVWIFSLLRRLYVAFSYFTPKVPLILSWGFRSREFTNFTYDLTPKNLNYLSQLISIVTHKPVEVVQGYFKEVEENTLLKKTIEKAIESSDEKFYADKEVKFGRRLGWYAFVRALKPKVVIETGVDKGLGSVLLCAALLKNREEGLEGRYYGTDINPKAGYFLSGIYKEVGKILYGDSIETLSKFDQTIDLFINDSDHSKDYEYNEYLTIESLLDTHSVILSDNSHFSESLSKYALEKNRKFLYFQEEPSNHWYPGASIGISYT